MKTAGKKHCRLVTAALAIICLTLKLHVFENVTMDYLLAVSDGTKKLLIVKGAPDGTTIAYQNNGQTSVGEYIVTATLTKQYYETKVLTATLYIRRLLML